jgi:hypothetical protein
MRTPIVLTCVGFLLVGCSGGTLAPVAVSVAKQVIPPDQMMQLVDGCAAAKPMLDVASAPNMPAKVKDTAVYGKALCDSLLTGVVPPTVDSNTPEWFDTVVKGTQIAAQVAKVVLPLVL